MKPIRFCQIILCVFCICSFAAHAQNNLTQLSDQFAKDFTIKDTLFNKPYVDIDEWRDKPCRHHYIHGGFKGTDTRFSFYFPAKENYKRHFFQYITPVPDSENI